PATCRGLTLGRAGEGLRTLDPDLGKVVLWPTELHPQRCGTIWRSSRPVNIGRAHATQRTHLAVDAQMIVYGRPHAEHERDPQEVHSAEMEIYEHVAVVQQ